MANRADQAGLVVQDIARSSVKKLVYRAPGKPRRAAKKTRRSKAKT